MIASILIIEDNVVDAQLMNTAVKSHCQTLAITRNLEDGLKYLRKNTPDIVMLDVGLPGYGNADSVIAAVKSVRHELTAIVVVSGNDDPDAITRALLADCAGWIVKGKWETLLLEVRAAYDNHRHHLRRVKQNQEIRARLDGYKPLKEH